MKLKLSHLKKTYVNGTRALDDLNLEIGQGMFALLGPNGAGKSSLMRSIASLQRVDSGQIHFNGIDVLKNPMQLRRVLGYLPQDFGLYPKLSALKLLDYFARLKGIANKKERQALITRLLELTNLYEYRKKELQSYSGGMKQRFGIAQLLLNQPQLIIVDEPTAGLDPAERHRFLNILREVAADNVVIFSTHIVDDVTELCQDMAILNKGRILKRCKPSEAVEELEGKIWTCSLEAAELSEAEAKFNVLSSSFKEDNRICIRVFSQSKPNDCFQLGEAQLDDLYFLSLKERL